MKYKRVHGNAWVMKHNDNAKQDKEGTLCHIIKLVWNNRLLNIVSYYKLLFGITITISQGKIITIIYRKKFTSKLSITKYKQIENV